MPTDPIPTTRSRPIILTAWQPRWSAEYQHIAAQLRAAAGDDALRIDHVGSTSVPGLAAKDVIDIQVTVADLAGCDALVARLRAAGFTRGDSIEPDGTAADTAADPRRVKRYMREPHGTRRTHIHIREQGRRNQRDTLLFRDYLRAEPAVRAHYETVKRRAAQLFPESVDGYMWLKDAPIRIILEAAALWAATHGWEADPSSA